MRNPIIRYVRNSFGDPFGCVVAIEDTEYGFAVGWSQCNPCDQFRKSVARDLAMHRAQYGVKPHVKYGWPHVDFGYPEPAMYNDPIYGKQPWISEAIYNLIVDAEEKFLGRVTRDILGNPI
jgi:hypothetical protein